MPRNLVSNRPSPYLTLSYLWGGHLSSAEAVSAQPNAQSGLQYLKQFSVQNCALGL